MIYNEVTYFESKRIPALKVRVYNRCYKIRWYHDYVVLMFIAFFFGGKYEII